MWMGKMANSISLTKYTCCVSFLYSHSHWQAVSPPPQLIHFHVCSSNCATPNAHWHPSRDASRYTLFNLYCPFWQMSSDCFDEWRLDCSGVDLTVLTCFLCSVIYVFPYDLILHSKSQRGMIAALKSGLLISLPPSQLCQQFFTLANEKRGWGIFEMPQQARRKEKVKQSLANVFFFGWFLFSDYYG